MTNIEKYNSVFIRTLGVDEGQLADLKYKDVLEWDSVGHMGLIAEIESEFNVFLDPQDIMGFDSYKKGIEILSKSQYGVEW